MQFRSKSMGDTEAIAKRVASLLRAGDFVAFRGGLGVGKTTFIRGLVNALGYGAASSPSFSIVHEYEAELPVLHMDWYRLTAGEELFELGYEDYFQQKALFLVEWPERAEEILPQDRLEISMSILSQSERLIEMKGFGLWQERLEELQKG